MSYRPITDVWILARPKIKYYGAYPSGFLERARALLGVTINDPVLHVCSGEIKKYPFYGFGLNDMTLDQDESLKPDLLVDINQPDWTFKVKDKFRKYIGYVQPKAILADPPYTLEDHKHYKGFTEFPEPNKLLKDCLDILNTGGRVGMLHYIIPRPPKKTVKFVACVGVMVGFNNRIRAFSVFEKR